MKPAQCTEDGMGRWIYKTVSVVCTGRLWVAKGMGSKFLTTMRLILSIVCSTDHIIYPCLNYVYLKCSITLSNIATDSNYLLVCGNELEPIGCVHIVCGRACKACIVFLIRLLLGFLRL